MAAGQSGQNQLNQSFIVGDGDDNTRLDIFLAAKLEGFSRTRIQKIIGDHAITINKKPARAKDLLREGDEVKIVAVLDIDLKAHLTPTPMTLNILFEDEFLLVINKPYGLVVHPGSGVHTQTLLQGLLHYAQTKASKTFTPILVHRLDKDTSGVLVCAKSESIHAALAKQFKDKTNLRQYAAVLNGTLPSVELSRFSYLRRDPNHRTRFCSMEVEDFNKMVSDPAKKPKNLRYAVSHFKILKSYRQRLCFVEVALETGRTHQIRVHAQDLHAPVLGDPLYGTQKQLPVVFQKALREKISGIKRQMLHAKILGFTHPISRKKIAFQAPMPEDMQNLLSDLENYSD